MAVVPDPTLAPMIQPVTTRAQELVVRRLLGEYQREVGTQIDGTEICP